MDTDDQSIYGTILHVDSSYSRMEGSDGDRSDISSDQASPPTISRHKRLWSSLKSRARVLRSLSKRSEASGASGASRAAQSDSELDRTRASGPRTRSSEDRSRSRDRRLGEGVLESLLGSYVRRLSGGARVDDSQSVDLSTGQEKDTDRLVSAVDSRLSSMRSLPFFELDVVLREGRDLYVRDNRGSRDPYVRFMIGNKQQYRSRTMNRTLNPVWDERFSIPIEDPFSAVRVELFNHDRGFTDEAMGWAAIHPVQLELNKVTELKLTLREDIRQGKTPPYLGYIIVQCTLVPKSNRDKEQYSRRMLKLHESQTRRIRTQLWSAVVTILLIEADQLLSVDDNGLSDPYVKFKLGNERYKSRYKPRTLSPRWLEQFDLYQYEDQTNYLEMSVMDHDTGGRDTLIGRAEIDLSGLTRDRTHSLHVELDEGAGNIHLLITISGIAGYQTGPAHSLANKIDISQKYGILKSFSDLRNVGWLQVKVIRAQGLSAGDVGGKSDPFCVVELGNSRLQTHTEYKTLSPHWDKTFTFIITDIHSALEVSVFDEDRDKKFDFLGRVSIPLLRVRRGERVWYQLKDRKLTSRMKGAVLIEIDLVYNMFKAAIRTFNPVEKKYLNPEVKFRVATMKKNIDRVLKFVQAGIDTSKFIQSCFDWNNTVRSILAFIVFLVSAYMFELYMIPVILLIVYIKNLLFVQVGESILKDKNVYASETEEVEQDEEKDNKEDKKSFKEKLVAIQDACLQVQEITDQIACMGERLKNSMYWSVPWLSWLMVVALSLVTVVLYFIPLRVLVILWIINKFTKKLRNPNYIPNNELIDYLSRVPSDRQLVQYREFRPDASALVRKKTN